MKFRILVFLTAFFFISSEASSQAYDSSVGLRFGDPTALSYKKFINETGAIELLSGIAFRSDYNRISLGLAYQIHAPFESIEGLQWYYGAGASINRFNYNDVLGVSVPGYTGVGLNVYLGLEYTFSTQPFTVSLDWSPSIIFGSNTFGGTGIGFRGYTAAFRYILGR